MARRAFACASLPAYSACPLALLRGKAAVKREALAFSRTLPRSQGWVAVLTNWERGSEVSQTNPDTLRELAVHSSHASLLFHCHALLFHCYSLLFPASVSRFASLLNRLAV